MANFFDLDPTQTKSSDGKYIDLVFTGFVPDTDYGLTFAWVYEDAELGVSGESSIYDFKTIPEPDLPPPYFIENNLDAIADKLYVTWNGKDATNSDYPEGVLKQVNIWIKGGDFGEEYVQFGTSFSAAGTIQISATKVTTYCVKLQAEANTPGKLSPFSNEFCITLLEQPSPVYEVRHEWVKRDLVLFWKFDVNLPKNDLADSFAISIMANNEDLTKYVDVDKTKIPPLEHKVVFPEGDLAAIFGQVTAFQTDYDAFIYVRDKNLQTSTVVGYDVPAYVDPLTPPVISATKGPMSYNVSFTNNSEFDRIYIEDSTNSGATWVDQGSSTSNPVYVPTTNSLTRQVRARFSRVRGGLTGYSNTVTVTPDKIDPTDETPPTNPTNVSATASVDENDKTGFSLQATISFTKSSDPDCRGYRVRWTTQTLNPIYEYGYVDHPATGNTVSFTVSGLIPNTTYYYQVASVDQFNNTQSYTTAGTFTAQDSVATAEGSLARLKSYISIGGATGDQFKFGTGILDSINTSITTTPSLTAAPLTGYHGILLNKTGNKNNFWLTTGQLRVGTDTQYMYFNGTDLYLTGDINARSGKISGNLTINNGGSFIARTADNVLNKVTLNHLGLFAYDANGAETTQIISNAEANAPTFTTDRAKIGNWTVAPNTISSTNITLTSGSNASATSIIATNSGSYVGIKPRATAGSDIVLWAGTVEPQDLVANNAASGQAGFQVNADGQLYATGAIISGKITVESGSSLGNLLNDTSKIYAQNDEPTGGTYKTGDAWVDTNDSNKLYIYDSTKVAPASKWVLAQDSASAKLVADSKKIIIRATQLTSPLRPNYTPPAGVSFTAGDAWYNTSNKNKLYIYDGASWNLTEDPDIADGVAAKLSLQQRLGSGVELDLLKSLIVNTDGAHIYSSFVDNNNQTKSKSSYDNNADPGFFIGWHKPVGQNKIWPAMNIGTDTSYMKFSSYNGVLEIKGNIVNGGDYWNSDGSFRLGGASGITKSASSNTITLGSNTVIEGNVKATSLDTTNTDIDASGNITIINGSKTTTISNNASISMTDTSTGWDAGGAITINAIRNIGAGGYGNENVSATFGANQIQLTRSGGSPSATYQSYIAHADELSGVTRGTLLISTGGSSGIALKPGVSSSQVQILGKLNPVFGIMSTYIQGDTTWNSRAIRNITVSSSAPSGGSEGDVWIQI
jgi:hypothetical protein